MQSRRVGLNHPSSIFTSTQPITMLARPTPASNAPFLLTVGTILTVCRSIKVVQQSDLALVERLGKFHSKLEPGLHFLIPFVDSIRATVTEREQVLDVPPQKCITSDNAPLVADAVVYWKIFDAEKSVYSVANLEVAIQNLVLTQLRAEIGKLTLDSTFSAREQINAVLLKDLDLATDPWGVKITRVEVRDIIPNKEILQAMELQMASERKKRAMIIGIVIFYTHFIVQSPLIFFPSCVSLLYPTASEGEQLKAVNLAEGQAQSRVIEAESTSKAVRLAAEAEADRLLYEASGTRKALEELSAACRNDVNLAVRTQLMREFIDAQKSLAASDNAKVVMTTGSADDFFARAATFIDATSINSAPQLAIDSTEKGE